MEPVPQLSWPANLFSLPYLNVATASSTAPLLGQRKTQTDDHICECGCKQRHNHSVSRVIEEEQYGMRTRRVVWYSSLKCRNKDMGIGGDVRHQRKS